MWLLYNFKLYMYIAPVFIYIRHEKHEIGEAISQFYCICISGIF